jgi:hypothetical protein
MPALRKSVRTEFLARVRLAITWRLILAPARKNLDSRGRREGEEEVL